MDSLWNTTANIYFPDKKKNLDKVNLYIEYKKTEIGKIIELLDQELIGLIPVKSRIREISALLLIDKGSMR